jgi:hypothetical protein
MTTYFEASDGHGESTLWAVEGNRHAIPAMRQSDVTPGVWPDVVARMTGTTIHADVDRDALARTARDAFANGWRTASPGSTAWPQVVDAILAALTGVPHD